MAVYAELAAAVDAVMAKAKESAEFKRRLKKLVELATTDGSYRDEDVRQVIDLIDAEGK